MTLPIMIFLGLDPATVNAKRYVFVLLVLAISAELVQLAWHYVFRAMWLAG